MSEKPTSETVECYRQAEQLKEEGDLEGAAKKLQEVLEIDPQHVLAHLTLAHIYSRTGEHAKAVEHGEKACEFEPDDAINFTALSVTYQRAFAGTQNMDFIRKAEDAMARAQAIQGTHARHH